MARGRCFAPCTLNPEPCTLNPETRTLNCAGPPQESAQDEDGAGELGTAHARVEALEALLAEARALLAASREGEVLLRLELDATGAWKVPCTLNPEP